MAEITANVRGLDELKKYFDEFPEKLQLKVLRGATQAGARVTAKEYKSRLPVRAGSELKWLGESRRYKTKPGFLKANVTVWRRKKGVTKHMVVYAAGVHTTKKQRPWPFYALILERGSKRGIRPMNYLKNALIATQDMVLETMRKRTEIGIEKQLSKKGK